MSEKTELVYCTVRLIDHDKTGLLVRNLRKAAKLSLEEVAAATRSSTTHLSALERGSRAWNEGMFRRVIAAIESLGRSEKIAAGWDRLKKGES